MRKRYLFMSSFFIIGTIFTLVFFLSYKSYDKEREEIQREEVHTVDTVKELRVNDTMKYVVESYDGTTGVVTSGEETIPAELAGKTRKEVEAYITEYNQTLSENKSVEEPDHLELISFSKDKLVVRETYSGEEEEKGFFLKLENEEVVIFHNDMVTPYEYTGIRGEVLPENEREMLLAGYFVEDEKELYSVLENLSS
ncbi:MAG: hypothetical protein NC293_01330 [Roseburia sp.]|nr:hypothetical protein [Roseburia sp.]